MPSGALTFEIVNEKSIVQGIDRSTPLTMINGMHNLKMGRSDFVPPKI